MTTRTCRTCGEALPVASTNAVCHRCRYAARTPWTRTCRLCGTEFTSKATGRICGPCGNQRRQHDECPKCGQPKDRRAKHCLTCREHPGNPGPRPDLQGPRYTTADVVQRALATAEPTPDGCLLVTEWRPQPKGYVRGPRVDERGAQMLHRLIVEHHRGARLAPADSVDHACHNSSGCTGGPDCRHRRCINIDHLEVVDAVENWNRGTLGAVRQRREKTHCPHGHPYAGRNLGITKSTGARYCKACKRAKGAGRDPRAEQAVV